MAKGDQKVQSEDESSESESEFEWPSYDELVHLLNKYTKIIRKTRCENDKLENEMNIFLQSLNLVMSLETRMISWPVSSRS